MLKTNKAYRDTVEAIRVLEEEEIPAERARWLERGASAEAIRVLLAPLRARIVQLRHEAEVYERVCRGDISMFADIEDVGQVLVAARLARGWSQRQLAERLGVHESQVSRDERHEYQGIALERLQLLRDILELDLVTVPKLRGIDSKGSPSIAPSKETAAPELSTAETVEKTVGRVRSAGWVRTQLPAAPHAGRRWLASPQLRATLSREDIAHGGAARGTRGEASVEASLPRLGVFFLTGAATAGATGGATGPLGPFVYATESYLRAEQPHDAVAVLSRNAEVSDQLASGRHRCAA